MERKNIENAIYIEIQELQQKYSMMNTYKDTLVGAPQLWDVWRILAIEGRGRGVRERGGRIDSKRKAEQMKEGRNPRSGEEREWLRTPTEGQTDRE
tara:strand:+ start:180 stop:467 length:288 start_codon:yes stop_codon:yes gene_type:complete